MRREACREPPRNNLFPDLAASFLPVQIHHVNGELHSKAMHRFAWSDPQALTQGQLAMFQQACSPLRAGIRHFCRFGQNGTAVAVRHLDLQDLGYNTIPASDVAPVETFSRTAGFRGRIKYCRVLQEYRSVKRVSLAFIVCSVIVCRAQQQAPVATFGSIIGLGGTPSDIVLDELRGRLYLVNNHSNKVDIYGIAEKALIGSIPVGLVPLSAAISMDGAFLFVTNQQSSSLSVIDLGTRAVVQTVTLPAQPQGVGVGADGRALIATAGSGPGNTQNTLLIYDRTQQSSQALFPVQVSPPPSTITGVPSTTLVRPDTAFFSKLIRTPDGQFIVGLTNPGTSTYMFVYEVASGVILRSRTVAGQSTVRLRRITPEATSYTNMNVDVPGLV